MYKSKLAPYANTVLTQKQELMRKRSELLRQYENRCHEATKEAGIQEKQPKSSNSKSK